MEMDEKKLADELKNAFEAELKPRIEQMETESKTLGTVTTETKQAIDRVQDRLDEIEVTFQKAADAPQFGGGAASQETKDFVEFTRKGELPAESKVLKVGDATLGGVLAPVDFIAEVIKGVVQYSPIRSIAAVRKTSRTSIAVPKRTGNFAASWAGEVQTRTENTGRTYGLEEIPTHELYARVLISNWDLEDPIVDLEADIRDSMAEQFGVSEGAAFVSGNGVAKPEGFLTNSDVEQVLNGGASFANADGLIKLQYALKEQYWPNARFVLNRLSLRDLRLVKDTTGNYIWAPGLGPGLGITGGMPSTLLGSEYVMATDMPTAASNALTVSFGDFSKAYWIADRIEISYLRDPFTAATGGAVVFHARKRVGGQIVLPEALKTLKMA